MSDGMSGVIREVRRIARDCNRIAPGIIGIRINPSGVYACREDWRYFPVRVSTTRLISEMRKISLSVSGVSCLIDSEAPESWCIDNGVLQFYELRI